MKSSNLYDILGVPKDATNEQINKAYRKRAKEAHPDKGGDPEEFRAVNTAKQVLLNPRLREKYDNTGEFDDTPDNRENEIIGVAMQAFNEAIAEAVARGGSPTRTNLVSSAIKKVNLKMDAKREEVKTHKHAVEITKKVLGRLRVNDKKKGYIIRGLENQARKYEDLIKGAENGLEVFSEALELLKCYTFDVEETELEKMVRGQYGNTMGMPPLWKLKP